MGADACVSETVGFAPLTPGAVGATLGHRAWHVDGIGQRSQIHPPDSIREGLAHSLDPLQGEARFAATAWPGEHQPASLSQGCFDRGQVSFTPDETRERGGQVAWTGEFIGSFW